MKGRGWNWRQMCFNYDYQIEMFIQFFATCSSKKIKRFQDILMGIGIFIFTFRQCTLCNTERHFPVACNKKQCLLCISPAISDVWRHSTAFSLVFTKRKPNEHCHRNWNCGADYFKIPQNVCRFMWLRHADADTQLL